MQTHLVADYEEKYFPVSEPSLIDVIKLRIHELGLKQKDLAELLETSTSRISEYLKGKREHTLRMAKKVHNRLNIDADIIAITTQKRHICNIFLTRTTRLS